VKDQATWEVVVVGAGLAGLSAAIYLGRAKRRTLLIDAGGSLAVWEPDVQNYLGFPNGVSGEDLLKRGREQAARYEAEFTEDRIKEIRRQDGLFVLKGKTVIYYAQRVLLATGLFHLPPEIPRVKECLGHSMFFCKDCDGFRVQGKRIAIVGHNNEAVEYALGMLLYTACVVIVTNGKPPGWDEEHARWIKEYEIPFYTTSIVDVETLEQGMIGKLVFKTGPGVVVDALFTTRGDIFHNDLAISLGAELDEDEQVKVDHCMRTTVPGLYAAGCVTPANCQMTIDAGQGAAAAQAINRDLFEESLRNHRLRRFRAQQIKCEQTDPLVH